MASIPGQKVSGQIVPGDDQDTWPVVNPRYVLGSLRTVGTISERNAITPARREEGMVVYVTGGTEGQTGYYALIGGTSDSFWTKDFRIGTGGDAIGSLYVKTFNGATGDILLVAGTGITIGTNVANKTVTVNNNGVLQITNGNNNTYGIRVANTTGTGSVLLENTGVTHTVAGSGIALSGNFSGASGTVTITNTGVTGMTASAGSGIRLSGTTGNITITNIGVTGLQLGKGADSYLSLSGSTGNISISNEGVQSFGGVTGEITFTLNAGLGIDVANTSSGKDFTYTVTNTGVTEAVAGSGVSVSAATGRVVISSTGITGITAQAGSGISISGTTGNITITNIGVTGLSSSEALGIRLSGSTGNITLTNVGVTGIQQGSNIVLTGGPTGNVTVGVTTDPSFNSVTTTGNLTVGGNFTVNGTTTIVDSTTVTIKDPVIVLGSTSGAAATVDDGLDRGIAFSYVDTTGKTGFFGWDDSVSKFIFMRDGSLAGNIVNPTTYGTVVASNYETIAGGTVSFRDGDDSHGGSLSVAGNLTANRTYTLPDASGQLLVHGMIYQGSGITVANSSAGVTIHNAGVLLAGVPTSQSAGNVKFNVLAATGIGIGINAGSLSVPGQGATYTWTLSNDGVTGISAGTGISVTPGNGRGRVTVTNEGVLSINGQTGNVSGTSSVRGTDYNIIAFNETFGIPGTGSTAYGFGLTGNVQVYLPPVVKIGQPSLLNPEINCTEVGLFVEGEARILYPYILLGSTFPHRQGTAFNSDGALDRGETADIGIDFKYNDNQPAPDTLKRGFFGVNTKTINPRFTFKYDGYRIYGDRIGTTDEGGIASLATTDIGTQGPPNQTDDPNVSDAPLTTSGGGIDPNTTTTQAPATTTTQAPATTTTQAPATTTTQAPPTTTTTTRPPTTPFTNPGPCDPPGSTHGTRFIGNIGAAHFRSLYLGGKPQYGTDSESYDEWITGRLSIFGEDNGQNYGILTEDRQWSFGNYSGIVPTPSTFGLNNTFLMSTGTDGGNCGDQQPIWTTIRLAQNTSGYYVENIVGSTGIDVVDVPPTTDYTYNEWLRIDLKTITSGLNFELFGFTAQEFVNTNGVVSLGIVDGGVY